MDMPEPWVILIFVELFWSKSLSHFAEKAWVVSCHQDFTVPWVNFPIISQKYAGKFSYFPPKAWVIFKTLSYFGSKILELFLKCRKNKPVLSTFKVHLLQWHTNLRLNLAGKFLNFGRPWCLMGDDWVYLGIFLSPFPDTSDSDAGKSGILS